MDEEIALLLEPVTEEEALYAARMLNDLLARETYYALTEEVHKIVNSDIIVVPLDQLNLEAMSQLMGGQFGGWTDPIGQISSWIYDRIKEVSSWFARTVEGIFRQIWDSTIKPFLSTIQTMLSNVAPQVISSVTSAISNAAQGFANAVTNAVSNAVNSIVQRVSNFFAELRSRFESALAGLKEAIYSRMGELVTSMMKMGLTMSAVATLVGGIPEVIPRAVQGAIQGFISGIEARFSSLGQSLSAFREAALSGLARVSEFLSKASESLSKLGEQTAKLGGYLQQVGVAFTGFVNAIIQLPDLLLSRFQQLFSDPFTVLKEVGNALIRFLLNPWGGLMDLFQRLASWIAEQIWSLLPDWLKEWISGLGKIWSDISGWLGNIRDAITSSLAQVGQWIWERLPEPIRNALSAIGDFFRNIWEGLQALWRDPIGFLQARFQELSQWIWERLPDWVKSGWEKIVKFFTEDVPKGLQSLKEAFSEFLKDPVGFLKNRLDELSRWIWEHMPDWLKEGWQNVLEMGKQLAIAYMEYRRNPIGFLRERVVPTLIKVISWVIERISDFAEAFKTGLSWLWDQVSTIFGPIIQAATTGATTILGIIISSVSTALSGLRHIFGLSFEFFVPLVRYVMDTTRETFERFLDPILSPVFGDISDELAKIKAFVVERATYYYGAIKYTMFSLKIATLWALAVLPARSIAWALRALGNAINESVKEVEAAGQPGGVGVKATFSPWKAIAASLMQIADITERSPAEIYRSMLNGLYVWIMQPMARMANFYLRNTLPVELPSLGDLMAMIHRVRTFNAYANVYGGAAPSELMRDYDAFRGYARLMVSLYGYSDYFTDFYMARDDEFFVTVKDRFETQRKIPLGLIWAIPSLSDITMFYVRDIFYDFQSYMAAASIQGLTKDLAAFYYLARFKYPPPSALAQFYWRGVTGTLWLDMTFEEDEPMRLLGVGYKPKTPAELNMNAEVLNRIIHRYMKWHDLFPLAWDKDFPTDKSIMVELMADLPDKADMRWMTRWGLLEHLSSLGLSLTTPVEQIIDLMRRATGREMIGYIGEGAAGSEITYDVRLLARLLEARGLHPYFAPIASVSEAHIALADEMTLLRTGFITSYREGLITLSDASKLMSGLFSIKFITGYIDPETCKPQEVVYRKPLFWLPAEQRLLLLRAIFDRLVDLMRDMIREASSAVRRLGLQPKEAYEMIKTLFEDVVHHVSNQVKKVTGTDWRPVLDEEYAALWIKYGELARLAEIRTWIRNYATRLMAWIMYRLSYGWVEPAEFRRTLNTFVEKGWITRDEAEFFIFVMEQVLGIVRREMVPTPLTLASMAEYMNIPDEVTDFVLNFYRVPEPKEIGDLDIRALYRTYIKVRPFMDEVRSLLTAYYRARRYMVQLPADVESRVKEIAKKYGFTDEELGIRDLAAHIQYLTDIALGFGGEVFPTLSALATMSEHVEIPLDYIHKVLTVRRVEPTYAQLWLKYIFAKQISAEVNAFVSNVKGLLERYAIPDELVAEIKNIMRLGGWSEAELFIFDWDVGLRRYRRILDTLVPTLRQLIGDSLYIGQLETLLKDWAITRGIDPEVYKHQLEYYMKLAKSRAIWRQVSYYRTRMITAYAYGAISKEQLKTKLERLKTYGLTDEEIELLMDAADVYRAQRVGIRWNLVRSYWEAVIEAYAYGAITDADLERLLYRLKDYGLSDEEIKLLIEQARLVRRMMPFMRRT